MMEKYIFDLILLLISLIIIIYSAKKGFASTILGTASVVFATIFSKKGSVFASEFIYSSFLRVKITEKVSNAVNGFSDSISLSEKFDAMISSLPEWMLRISESNGLDLGTVSAGISKSDVSEEMLVESFTDGVVYPVVTDVIKVVLFVAFFVLLIVLLFKASKLLSKVIKKLPVIGKANTFFGMILGVVKSVAIVFIICMVLNTVSYLFEIEELKLMLSDSIIFNNINNILN